MPPLVRGAEDAAWRENYLLIMLNSGDRMEREREILSVLRSRRVDGVLLVAAIDADAGHIRALKDADMPIVCLDRELQGLGSIAWWWTTTPRRGNAWPAIGRRSRAPVSRSTPC